MSKSTKPEIVIEKDVPLPRPSIPPLPLSQMEVGDSFLVPVSEERHKTAIAQRLTRYKRANPPKQFSMRTVDDETVRVYRLEDAER